MTERRRSEVPQTALGFQPLTYGRYEVQVDAEIHDPTDPDLFSEQVLEGEYAAREAALIAAAEVSRRESALTMVYDRERVSPNTGEYLLIAAFDDGKELR